MWRRWGGDLRSPGDRGNGGGFSSARAVLPPHGPVLTGDLGGRVEGSSEAIRRELSSGVRAAQQWIGRHPGTSLAAALSLGALLGWLAKRK